jgi:hypothetical protein
MLEKQDLDQIQSIITASEKRVIQTVIETVTENVTTSVVEAVGEMIEHNILPQFDDIRSQMVTKDFLEERLTKFKEGLTDSALWVGKQMNRLTDVLYRSGTISAEQVLEIRRGKTT